MLHCPLQYCTTMLFITLMPFQWCHSEVRLRNRGCQWRFDWQRHRRVPANGGRLWQLVVMRMGRQEGGASLVPQPCNGIDIYPPRHRCVPSARRRTEEDSNAHAHSTAPILQLTAAKWEGGRGEEGGDLRWWGSEERRQSSQTFQGPPFQSNEA